MRNRVLWRVGATVALLLYAAVAFLVIRLIIQNLAVSIAVGITSAVLIYASWLVFSGMGPRKRKGMALLVISGIALVIEVVMLLGQVSGTRIIVAILTALLLYAGCVGLLRSAYWREERRMGQSGDTADFSSPWLIINPKSGNGRAMKAHIDTLAAEQGIHVVVLQKGDDVEAVARRAVQNGADVLGVSGGDGSIGAVAKVAIEHDLPMVVLPGGTRCHFARDLGLDPKRITESLAGFIGVERKIDAGDINGRIFLNNVSFGLYADMVMQPDYREHKLAVARRILTEISNGERRPYDLRFSHGNSRFDSAVQVVVSVNRYQTQSIIDPIRRERLDEGVLQVSVISRLNDALVRKLLQSTSPDRLLNSKDETGFYQWEDKAFRVTSSAESLTVGVDGENESYKVPVEVRVLPGALSIYVPAEGVRSRPVRFLSLSMARYLWQEAVHGQLSR